MILERANRDVYSLTVAEITRSTEHERATGEVEFSLDVIHGSLRLEQIPIDPVVNHSDVGSSNPEERSGDVGCMPGVSNHAIEAMADNGARRAVAQSPSERIVEGTGAVGIEPRRAAKRGQSMRGGSAT